MTASFASIVRFLEKLIPLFGLALLALGLYWIFAFDYMEGRNNDDNLVILKVVDPSANAERSSSPYAAFSEHLIQELKDVYGEDRVDDKETTGSLHSIIRLDELSKTARKLDFAPKNTDVLAIVQADVLYAYVNGNHPLFPVGKKRSRVRAIARLFSEKVHLVVKGCTENCLSQEVCQRDNDYEPPICEVQKAVFSSDEDYQAFCCESAEETWLNAIRNVCAGQIGSGSLVTANGIRGVIGADWTIKYDCPKEVDFTAPHLQLLVRGDEPSVSYGSRLVRFNRSQALVVSNAYPNVYSAKKIENGSGTLDSNDKQDLNAPNDISINAILVSNRNLDESILHEVEEILSEIDSRCRREGQSGIDKLNNTDICKIIDTKDDRQDDGNTEQLRLARYKDLPIALHPELLDKLLDPVSRFMVSITDPAILKIILIWLLGTSMLASLIPGLPEVVRSNQGFIRLANIVVSTRTQWLGILGSTVVIHVFFAVVIWLSEFHNHALGSDAEYISGGLAAAFHWIFKFVVFGYSDIEFESPLAVAWIGILKVGWAIASFALTFALAQAGTRWLKAKRMTKHIIILGWNKRGASVSNELARQGIRQKVLFFNSEDKPDVPQTGETSYVSAHGLEKELADAGYMSAQAIIVLADDLQAKKEDRGDVDSWVCRNVLAVRRCIQSTSTLNSYSNDTSPRIIAESVYEENISILRSAGADDVICVNRFGTELLAQAATREGIRAIFEELLKTTRDTQELYTDELTSADVVRYQSFDRAVKVYATKWKGKHKRLPIGILRKNDKDTADPKHILNPTGEQANLMVGDKLIVLAKSLKNNS